MSENAKLIMLISTLVGVVILGIVIWINADERCKEMHGHWYSSFNTRSPICVDSNNRILF